MIALLVKWSAVYNEVCVLLVSAMRKALGENSEGHRKKQGP